MQAGRFRWLVFAMGSLPLAGCAQNESARVEVSLTSPPRPFVFYHETGNPSGKTTSFSEVELRETMAWVAARTSDRVWLIRVRPSLEKGMRNNMVAYLVPDEATSRIRVGRAYAISASRKQTDVCSPWKYAQVSMPGHTFPGGLTKPPATEMPFEWPMVVDPNSNKTSPMPKEEVVAISDCLRRWASDMHIKDTRPDETMARDILRLPILRMNVMGERIVVTLGYMHEPLWGHGLGVLIKRTRTGYSVLKWNYWWS